MKHAHFLSKSVHVLLFYKEGDGINGDTDRDIDFINSSWFFCNVSETASKDSGSRNSNFDRTSGIFTF